MHGARESDDEIVICARLDRVETVTRDPRSGDFFVVMVGFDTTLMRVHPSGRVLSSMVVTFPEAQGTGRDAPDGFDIDFWPGRSARP